MVTSESLGQFVLSDCDNHLGLIYHDSLTFWFVRRALDTACHWEFHKTTGEPSHLNQLRTGFLVICWRSCDLAVHKRVQNCARKWV